MQLLTPLEQKFLAQWLVLEDHGGAVTRMQAMTVNALLQKVCHLTGIYGEGICQGR